MEQSYELECRGHRYVYSGDDTHVHKVDGTRVPGCSTIAGVSKPADPLVYWALGQFTDCLLKYVFAEQGKLFFKYPEVKNDKGIVLPISGKVIEVTLDTQRDIYKFAKDEHKREKERAADRGTRVHDWGHKLWLGKQEPVAEDIQLSIDAFLRWRDEWQVRPLYTECHVFHPEHRFAGIFDLIAMVRNPVTGREYVCLIDYKTSKSVYESHIIQSGGYKICHDWMNHEKPLIQELGILSIHPETGYPLWINLEGHAPEIEAAFITSLEMYRAKATIGRIRYKFKKEIDKNLALLQAAKKEK